MLKRQSKKHIDEEEKNEYYSFQLYRKILNNFDREKTTDEITVTIIYENINQRYNAVPNTLSNATAIFTVAGGLLIGKHSLIIKATEIEWSFPIPIQLKNVKKKNNNYEEISSIDQKLLNLEEKFLTSSLFTSTATDMITHQI